MNILDDSNAIYNRLYIYYMHMKDTTSDKGQKKKASVNSSLGIYLKSLREAKGFTQSDIADALGIIQQTYSHYETGRIIPPTRTLSALARIYDVSADDLVSLSDSDGDSIPVRAHAAAREDMYSLDDEYESYLKSSVNIPRLQFLSESEKRILFLFSKLDSRDRQNLLDSLPIIIRNSR